MSKTLQSALSLADEFHKAAYLDQVDPKIMKSLALMIAYVLDQDESLQVIKKLAKVDPALEIDDLSFETIEDHPYLSKDQRVRLAFWSMAILGALLNFERGPASSPAEQEELDADSKEWLEGMRRELEENDPAFARYVFGPNP